MSWEVRMPMLFPNSGSFLSGERLCDQSLNILPCHDLNCLDILFLLQWAQTLWKYEPKKRLLHCVLLSGTVVTAMQSNGYILQGTKARGRFWPAALTQGKTS